MAKESLIQYPLKRMIEAGGNTLHLTADQPAHYRDDSGALKILEDRIYQPDTLEAMLKEICTPATRWDAFCANHQLEFTYEMPGPVRFHVVLSRNYRGCAGVFRRIPAQVPSLEELNAPDNMKRLCQSRGGLIMVATPENAGGAAVIAALVNEINKTVSRAVMIIEARCGFVHNNIKSLILHREISASAASYGDAMRSVRFSDPDVIVLDALPDPETTRLALEYAAGGTLVITRMHSDSVQECLWRIIRSMPADQQQRSRMLLAGCIQGIITNCGENGKNCSLQLRNDLLVNAIADGKIDTIGL